MSFSILLEVSSGFVVTESEVSVCVSFSASYSELELESEPESISTSMLSEVSFCVVSLAMSLNEAVLHADKISVATRSHAINIFFIQSSYLVNFVYIDIIP